MTGIDLTTGGLAELCGRARPEMACLGELAAPLVTVVGVVEQVGAGRGVDALADPTFALDVLAAVGPGSDPAVVGRVLDFLRARLDAPASGAAVVGVGGAPRRPVALTEAVERYQATALKLMAAATQAAYNPWLTRLVAVHGGEDPAMVTAGDLKEVIAAHVVVTRERGNSGRSTEAMAIAAYRALWSYFGDKRWVTENVALRLRKPRPSETSRRGWRPDEAALARQLARGLHRADPLLSEVTLCLSERMGLRRDESKRLRICDVKLDRALAKVAGKGNKPRVMSIPPVFLAVLRLYIEQRRPADIAPEVWLCSEEFLLRHKPNESFPMGRRAGGKRVDRIMVTLRNAAPELFPADELFLHTYRHALATWCETNYSRTLARKALGHTSNQDPTDSYLQATDEELAVALAAYEQYLLAADPHHRPDPPEADDPEEAAA